MDFTEIPRDDDDALDEDLESKPGCLLRFVRVALVTALVFILLAALVPALMSSAPGREWAVRKINAAIAPAEVTIGQWSLGWFSAPVLDNVTYADASKGMSVKAEQVVFDKGLLRLLPIGTLSLGRVTVKKPDIFLSVGGFQPLEQRPGVAATMGAKPSKGFFLPIVDASGTLVLENGRLTVNGQNAHGFLAQRVDAEVAVPSWRKPVDVKVQAQVGNGTVALDGRLASLAALAAKSNESTAETLALRLSQVNLAAFTPLLRQFSDGVWFDSGEANGTLTLAMTGAEQFRLNGDMMVTGLSVANGQNAPSPKTDIELLTDIAYAQGEVNIVRFELTSPWVKAKAKGAFTFGAKGKNPTGALHATAESDLPALVRDFGPALGFSPEFSMQSGRLHVELSIDAKEKTVGIDAALVTEALQMRFAREPLVLKPAPSLMLKASIPHDGYLEIGELKFIAPFADISASGTLASGQAKGRLNLTAFSRDFRRVFKSLPPMVGEIGLDASTQPATKGATAFHAALTAKDLALELKPNALVVVPQGTLKVSGSLPEGKAFSEIQNASFDLTVTGGNAKGECKRFAYVAAGNAAPLPLLQGFSMSSEFEFASLRRLVGAFLPEGVRAKTAGWGGQFILNATAEAANGTTKARLNAAGQNISGKTETAGVRIPDIRLSGALAQERAGGEIKAEAEMTASGAMLRDGQAVFAENGAKLKTDLIIAPDFNRIQAKAFTLTSDLLGIQGSLDATELQSRCMVAAQGKLTVNCESVTRLLDAQGIDEWTLTGRDARSFTFKAPLAGGINTLFAEGEIDAAVFIKSLKGLGLDAGASDLSVKLSRGVMKVAYTPPLNGGKLRCVPEFRLERNNLTCTLPPKTRLLENVQVSQGIMDMLLVNIFPVFKGSLAQDGGATLDVASFKYVNGIAPDKGLAADSTLQLKNPKLTLGAPMREILTLLKIKSYSWQTGLVTVRTVIKDGRIHIAPVRIEIEKQPMTFSGWVAFNGAINYQIEIPLTERLIGKVASRAVSERSVKLPVTGTVNAPKIDTLALTKALANVVSETVIEEITDRATDVLDRLKKEFSQ